MKGGPSPHIPESRPLRWPPLTDSAAPCWGLWQQWRGGPTPPPRPVPTGSLSSSKASQDRKLTSTPREIAKSPHSAMPEHHPHPISPYEHLLRGVSGVDLYRGHIPLAFDPSSIPRGIPLDAGDCLGPTEPHGAGGCVRVSPRIPRAPAGLCWARG